MQASVSDTDRQLRCVLQNSLLCDRVTEPFYFAGSSQYGSQQ